MAKISPKAVQADIESRILTIRDQKVILDRDLARLYGVQTKVLNQAVSRNEERFPTDFAFLLTKAEVTDLKSQIVTSSSGHGGVRKLPWAFTEYGAIMAATVLKSPKAVEMSVFIVRAFVKMREQLMATATLAKRLAEVEKVLLSHDSALSDLYQKIRPLLLPPDKSQKKRIGFGVKESRARYRTRKKAKT